MTATLKQVINSLQLPINTKLTMAELRAKAVQQLGIEPASSTLESTEDSVVTETPNVNSHQTQ